MKIKIKTRLAIFLMLCPPLLSISSALCARSQTGTSYSVNIVEGSPGLVHVKLVFTPQDSVLYMARGANQLPRRWATFVHNTRLRTKSGEEVQLIEKSDARWVMKSAFQEELILEYTVRLDHESYEWGGGIDGVAYTKPWGVFITGRALFILNGDIREDISVQFELPDRWNITTPWKSQGEGLHAFTVKNTTELAESMLFAGFHQEITISRNDFELVFALGGKEIIAKQDEFRKLADNVLDYYISLMGGTPNPPPASKFSRVVVIINPGDKTDGEVIGNNISIIMNKNGDENSKTISTLIFAHEFFHLWNGKSFHPANNETEWFKEGFTNYYTLKALYRAGVLDKQSYFQVLNNIFFARYNTDEGVGKISMVMGQEKHDHWGLIYAGGLFVALCQDITIRLESDNKKSLDELMKTLFKKYGGTSDSYSLAELMEALSRISGVDQSEFFANFVTGSKRIPIAEYLSMTSVQAEIEDGKLRVKPKDSASKTELQLTAGILGATNK